MQSKPEGEGHVSHKKEYRDLDPGTLPKDMSQLDWSIWQAKLDKYIKATTQGKPTEHARRHALEIRLGPYWRERVAKAYSKEATEATYREMCDEIVHTIRTQQPVCRA